jgi:hypothetical protein
VFCRGVLRLAKWTKGNGPRTKFQPGQSGNPGGRPKLVDDIHALARPHAPAAIEALVKALSDPDRCIPAAIALLDRGFGKPAQSVAADVQTRVIVGGVDAPPRCDTIEEAERWLARRRKELAELTASGPAAAMSQRAPQQALPVVTPQPAPPQSPSPQQAADRSSFQWTAEQEAAWQRKIRDLEQQPLGRWADPPRRS